MKMDSRLIAYCHGNVDFPNVGAMLANPHDPYIQRGYRPFVIRHATFLDVRIYADQTLSCLEMVWATPD